MKIEKKSCLCNFDLEFYFFLPICSGPLTYQSMSRLPKNYRERMEREKALLRSGATESDSSSGIEQSQPGASDHSDRSDQSHSSGDTEGPEDDPQVIWETSFDDSKCYYFCFLLLTFPFPFSSTD